MKPLFEKISRVGNLSFHWRDIATTIDSPFHFHPECELTCVLEGDGDRFTGDHVGMFGPGDLVLHGANLPHGYRSGAGAPSRSPREGRIRLAQFSMDCLGGIFLKAPEFYRVHRMLERAHQGLEFRGSVRDWAFARFGEVFEQRPAERIPRMLEILIGLSQSHEFSTLASAGYSPPRFAEPDERISRVCAYVDQHFAEPIYLQRVAAMAHLTPAAFCRLFRRVLGKTFTAYVNEVRLGRANRLLQESTRSVTEICYSCGFENVANFNRHFRKLHGIPPRVYRKNQPMLPSGGNASHFVEAD